MDRKLKLLMTDTSNELCRLCKDIFTHNNIDIHISPRNGSAAYNDIIHFNPDFILLDVFMPGMDAMSLKKKYNLHYPDSNAIFYVMGTFQSEKIEKEVIENGFSFYFLKPFDVNVMLERILNDAGMASGDKRTKPVISIDEEALVTEMLREIGVPAHIKGYRFLRDAVLMVIDRPEIISSVTKVLYPSLAEKHATMASRVERAIRHAIEVAWDRCEEDVLIYYFGSTVHAMRGKPTNSEFIAILADNINMLNKKKA